MGKKICNIKISSYICIPFRAVSSVGSEHLPYKQRVTGSNPVPPTPPKPAFTPAFFVPPPPLKHTHPCQNTLCGMVPCFNHSPGPPLKHTYPHQNHLRGMVSCFNHSPGPPLKHTHPHQNHLWSMVPCFKPSWRANCGFTRSHVARKAGAFPGPFMVPGKVLR